MQDWYQRLQFDRLIILSARATVGVLLTLRATMPLLPAAVVVLLAVVVAALRQVISTRGGDAVWMIPPLLLTLSSSLFWRTVPDERAALVGSAIYGVCFLYTIIDYHQSRFGRAGGLPTWPNQAIVYLAVYMLFATLDSWGLEIVLKVILIAIAAQAASVSLLFREGVPRSAIQAYSLMMAVVAGEIAWALTYWPLPTFHEALALLMHVHVGYGMARAYHFRRFSAAVALEYMAVGAITGSLLLWTALGPPV